MVTTELQELAKAYKQADADWWKAEGEKRLAVRKAEVAHKWKRQLEEQIRTWVSETDPVKVIDVPGGVVHVQWINGAVGVAIKSKGDGK